MVSAVLYMSVSVDGYVAGPDDGPANPGGDGFTLHDWGLTEAGTHRADGPAGRMNAEYNETGAVLSGRRTAEQASHWGGDHHGGVPIFILSHRPPTDPIAVDSPLITYVSDIRSAMAQAKIAAGDRDVMVHGGARTVQALVEEDLLDEVQLHQVPVLLGGGVRLFDRLPRVELDIVRVIDTPEATHLRYRVRR